MKEPILYLSLYLKTYRQTYYDLLQAVRERGDWEAWLAFFLQGIAETSQQAADTARELRELFESDQRRIERFGRSAASALRVHRRLQRHPFVSVPEAARDLRLSPPTVANAIRRLERLGILRETTGKQRGRLYVYDAYLGILNRETEPM